MKVVQTAVAHRMGFRGTPCHGAATKRLSYRSGHTALVHNRSGMLAQAAEKLSYLAGIAVRRADLQFGY